MEHVHGHPVVAHAGPGDSFPLTGTAQNVRAAWDLAGKSKHGSPDVIRARVKAFARGHGLENALPESAGPVPRGNSHGQHHAQRLKYNHDDGHTQQDRHGKDVHPALHHDMTQHHVTSDNGLAAFNR